MSAKETANPANHHRGVPRCRTRLLIFSVTVAKSCPGASSACISGWGTWTVGCWPRKALATSPAIGGCSGLGSASGRSAMVLAAPRPRPARHLGVGVLDLGQVGRARPRVELRQQRVIAALALEA